MRISKLLLIGLCLPSTACTVDDDEDDGGVAATETGTTGTTTAMTTAPMTTAPGTTMETTTEPGTTMGMMDMGTPTDDALVRALHLAVNAPEVDVFVDGEGPVVEGLVFRDSSDYLVVPAGDHTLEISQAGMPADQALVTSMLMLDASTRYTVVAIGDFEETMGAPGLEVISIVDDDQGIDPGSVRITVVHAAPAVGEVDAYEITDPMNPMLLVENAQFGMVSTLPDVPAGALEIGIDVDDDMMMDVTFSIPDAGLGGMQVNAYANNDEMGNVALVAQLPDGTVLPIPANM